jgi:hypothetical protein
MQNLIDARKQAAAVCDEYRAWIFDFTRAPYAPSRPHYAGFMLCYKGPSPYTRDKLPRKYPFGDIPYGDRVWAHRDAAQFLENDRRLDQWIERSNESRINSENKEN